MEVEPAAGEEMLCFMEEWGGVDEEVAKKNVKSTGNLKGGELERIIPKHDGRVQPVLWGARIDVLVCLFVFLEITQQFSDAKGVLEIFFPPKKSSASHVQ